jgi:hypothetical protein
MYPKSTLGESSAPSIMVLNKILSFEIQGKCLYFAFEKPKGR